MATQRISSSFFAVKRGYGYRKKGIDVALEKRGGRGRGRGGGDAGFGKRSSFCTVHAQQRQKQQLHKIGEEGGEGDPAPIPLFPSLSRLRWEGKRPMPFLA